MPAKTCHHEIYVLINFSCDLAGYFSMVFKIYVMFSATFVEKILCFSKYLSTGMCCM